MINLHCSLHRLELEKLAVYISVMKLESKKHNERAKGEFEVG